MADGPRRKRAQLWVRVYAMMFDVEETRLREATENQSGSGGSDTQGDVDEKEDSINTQ
mgnify:FL=1|jgi:hypothetical protein